jgi:hypothetical protein
VSSSGFSSTQGFGIAPKTTVLDWRERLWSIALFTSLALWCGIWLAISSLVSAVL